MRYAPMGAEDDNSTEQNALGVVVKPDQVVVLASLKSKTTARLEKITVHPANGSPVEARFHASLKHFGCFLAKLESPLPRVIGDSGRNIVTYRDERIFFVDLNVQGGKRVGFYQPGGISFYKLRAQGRPYPELVGDYARTFLFDWSGNLLAMPLKERQTLSTEEFHEAANEAISTPFRYVLDSLAQLSDCSDPANVPLTEAEDSRLAWLGVELQPLNKDLARVNKVSDETRDGETGALVTYVYEGSPAAKTGLEPGNILLRVRSRAQPSAIDIKIEDDAAPESAIGAPEHATVDQVQLQGGLAGAAMVPGLIPPVIKPIPARLIEGREDQHRVITELVLTVPPLPDIHYFQQCPRSELPLFPVTDHREDAVEAALAVRAPHNLRINVDCLCGYCNHFTCHPHPSIVGALGGKRENGDRTLGGKRKTGGNGDRTLDGMAS